jgi:hypothetical protein
MVLGKVVLILIHGLYQTSVAHSVIGWCQLASGLSLTRSSSSTSNTADQHQPTTTGVHVCLSKGQPHVSLASVIGIEPGLLRQSSRIQLGLPQSLKLI